MVKIGLLKVFLQSRFERKAQSEQTDDHKEGQAGEDGWWWFTQCLMGNGLKLIQDRRMWWAYKNCLKSKARGSSSPCASASPKTRIPKPDALLSWPHAAHRTHSQVSFPVLPAVAWSPLKPHKPLKAKKRKKKKFCPLCVCMNRLCGRMRKARGR